MLVDWIQEWAKMQTIYEYVLWALVLIGVIIIIIGGLIKK